MRTERDGGHGQSGKWVRKDGQGADNLAVSMFKTCSPSPHLLIITGAQVFSASSSPFRVLRRHISTFRAAQAAPITSEVSTRIRSLLFPLLLGVGIYIVLAAVLVPPNESDPAFNFVDEQGAVTALSAVFLAAGCAFAFATFLFQSSRDRLVRSVWLLVTAALGFLVLDELLQFHERAGNLIERALPAGPSGVRGWNDVVVILYGVVSIPVGLALLPVLARYPTFLQTMAAAFVFYVIHTATDSLAEPETFTSLVIEESAKLYCSALIALACLSALLVHATPRLESAMSPSTE